MSTPVVKHNVKVSVGVGTYLGIGAAIASGVGAVIAAIKSNDLATAAGTAGATLTVIATVGSRAAQAVAIIRRGARYAQPFVDELAGEDEGK